MNVRNVKAPGQFNAFVCRLGERIKKQPGSLTLRMCVCWQKKKKKKNPSTGPTAVSIKPHCCFALYYFTALMHEPPKKKNKWMTPPPPHLLPPPHPRPNLPHIDTSHRATLTHLLLLVIHFVVGREKQKRGLLYMLYVKGALPLLHCSSLRDYIEAQRPFVTGQWRGHLCGSFCEQRKGGT